MRTTIVPSCVWASRRAFRLRCVLASTSLMKIPPAGQKEEKKRKEKGDDKRGGKTAISPLSEGKQGARRSSYLTYPYS